MKVKMHIRMCRGFTLVELLVVISIIALLLSILMPSLAKVREQAKTVVCLSNLHQWGMIFGLYTNDNNGYFNRGWGNCPERTRRIHLRWENNSGREP